MESVLTQAKDQRKSPFSAEELQTFRNLIEKKIEDAVEEIDYLSNSIKEMRENSAADFSSIQHHFADISSSDAAIHVNLRLLERTEKFVKQLRRALHRIDKGTYGICKVTGKPISKERLLAAPHTQHSIEAKLMRTQSLN
ncbi:MAG: TraR/DksA C4-type zinc finger protein [Balneolaceae bacterium]